MLNFIRSLLKPKPIQNVVIDFTSFIELVKVMDLKPGNILVIHASKRFEAQWRHQLMDLCSRTWPDNKVMLIQDDSIDVEIQQK